MNKTNNLCNNCGKQGHLYHQCKLPITSYGIIAFKQTIEGLQYLMIRRKNSFGFIDFVRGKYSPYNIYQLQNIIDEMSNEERTNILNNSFETLWENMWGAVANISLYKNEPTSSCKKMETIRDGVFVNNECVDLTSLVNNSTTHWSETEWEFPKGRRNYKEKDLDCALREFEEETGISTRQLTIVENVVPFEEIFIGTNHKSYKHKYFLAQIDESTELLLDNFQQAEVSKLECKTLDECLESIRPYNLEKKKLIININKVLQEYQLY